MIPTIGLAGSFANQAPDSGGGGGPSGDGTTWNPADKTTNVTLSSNDLIATANTSNYEMVRTVKADFNTANGGKFYWEAILDTLANVSDLFIGMKASANSISSGASPLTGTYALWRGNGLYYDAGGWSVGGGATEFAAGNRLMFALDVDNRKLFVGKNGTWNNSGNPAAGTNASFTNMPLATNHAFFMSTDNTAGAVVVTLVSDPDNLAYSAPAGFTAGI